MKQKKKLNIKYFSVLDEEEHVAVLFYEEKKRDSMKALQHLELIDDEADIFGIRFVRIVDPLLAEDYSLWHLPSLAFFRHSTPILYTGKYVGEDISQIILVCRRHQQ